MITSRQHFTGCPCFSALRSKLRWWHTIVFMADHQCTSTTSIHRSSLFPFVLGFVLLTTMTWLYHVLGPRVMVRAVSASRHHRFGTCCHLISRTVMLVANSSSRALRLGSFCKPTHKRRLWELCLSGALQILDWLIDSFIHWIFPVCSDADRFLNFIVRDVTRKKIPLAVNIGAAGDVVKYETTVV